ncbi:MAG: DUF3560 domain-containing protein [Bradyrhizobium sp.]|nr:DUF3560 domain-containing protein [Bradyrhizobium sp.]
MNSYEAKQEARRERLENRAAKLASEGRARVDKAKEMASIIPFGQPILVGHHSEKGDRAYRGRIGSNFDKGFSALKEADAVAAKAAAVGTGGVSSDDPDAVCKLREQLEALEKRQTLMTAANRLVRKKDHAGLVALGLGQKAIEALFTPDCIGRTGFADYQLKNNGANIRRIKTRIAAMEKLAAAREAAVDKKPKEAVHQSGVRVVENVEANRLQLFFPGKPDAMVRAQLKRGGFRWAPSEGAWQRQLSNGARYAAECVLRTLEA